MPSLSPDNASPYTSPTSWKRALFPSPFPCTTSSPFFPSFSSAIP